MSADAPRFPTSPYKGEVDREAIGRGSRFSRTQPTTARARRLRRTTTDAEQKLWRALRRDQLAGLHFRPQHPIGSYTLDFYCPQIHFAIELDGGQHAEQTKVADDRRTRWLQARGVRVVRYWNNDVLRNIDGVLTDLLLHIERLRVLTPSPTLPLAGGGSSHEPTS